MRALIQRVSQARVEVADEVIGQCGVGLLVLLGCGQGDDESDLDYVFEKVVNLRIFEDEQGKMNHSLLDIGGELLVVSQFTLYADTRRGRRPSFTGAMAPVPAEAMYQAFVERARARGITVGTGRFGAMMNVSLTNQGPVTIMIDSRER
ncbi:D-tyrosyl-tRNA(Tyr) deacylase [Lujinxingia litoralis]|uniref:D-aminoacyl-tRNA deacylase n=1 Tax=Lujinxingia litoralis TaxID=2211119 RepID=A0A328C3X3_9DELT|nr:D-aminoacyl-tRNA deacylase [Lujinxingia litoralis]RAL21228.1 D-tyrosyl-tRNA(Tyr) deacylase [Lujinxingia litoralis]